MEEELREKWLVLGGIWQWWGRLVQKKLLASLKVKLMRMASNRIWTGPSFIAMQSPQWWDWVAFQWVVDWKGPQISQAAARTKGSSLPTDSVAPSLHQWSQGQQAHSSELMSLWSSLSTYGFTFSSLDKAREVQTLHCSPFLKKWVEVWILV